MRRSLYVIIAFAAAGVVAALDTAIAIAHDRSAVAPALLLMAGACGLIVAAQLETADDQRSVRARVLAGGLLFVTLLMLNVANGAISPFAIAVDLVGAVAAGAAQPWVAGWRISARRTRRS